MKNRTMMLRSLIVATFVALLTVISAQDTAAQLAIWPCPCGYITVSSSSDIQCKFTLCVDSEIGRDCKTVIPGTQQIFKCERYATPWVKDCHGNQVYIKASCDLGETQVIAISEDCCIETCVTTDSQGCLVIKIWAHAAPCDKCP